MYKTAYMPTFLLSTVLFPPFSYYSAILIVNEYIPVAVIGIFDSFDVFHFCFQLQKAEVSRLECIKVPLAAELCRNTVGELTTLLVSWEGGHWTTRLPLSAFSIFGTDSCLYFPIVGTCETAH